MPQSTATCTYARIDDIHHIKLNTATRQAIEDIFDIFEQVLHKETSPYGASKYLLDASDCGDFSFRYLAQRAQKWNKEHPNIPTSRTAILYPLGMLSSMINVLIKQVSTNADTRIFTPEQFDEAVKWLRS